MYRQDRSLLSLDLRQAPLRRPLERGSIWEQLRFSLHPLTLTLTSPNHTHHVIFSCRSSIQLAMAISHLHTHTPFISTHIPRLCLSLSLSNLCTWVDILP